MFKQGQRVWCMGLGWGRVEQNSTPSAVYPWRYKNHLGKCFSFSVAGERVVGEGRNVFFDEIVIPPSALFPPWEPEFKAGDIVQVVALIDGSEVGYRRVTKETQEHLILIVDGFPSTYKEWDKSKYSFRKVGHV